MNQYPLENLNSDEFEELTTLICRDLLGIGVKNFSKGRDGAKDGWFEGTADWFPSEKKPWSGNFNIQAKHTSVQNASCSDSNFSSKTNNSAVLTKELKRLIEVKKETPFDCFLLFTNRKLSGEKLKLVEWIKSELGISYADLIGKEQIDSYLDSHPHLAHKFGLSKFIYPLRFFEGDIKKIILVFNEELEDISKATGDMIESFKMVDIETKNKLNNLGEEYFKYMIDHSLEYFTEINNFLIDSKNAKYLQYYTNTVSDLQAEICVKRSMFGEFQFLIEFLVKFIVNNNLDSLKDARRIVRVFIHFMYFNCDIGLKE